MRLVSFCLSVCMLAAAALAADEPLTGNGTQRILLDRFVARVNGNVILMSDIDFEMALLQLEKPDQASRDVMPDAEAMLERLIDRELLLEEARRFVARTVSTEEIDRIIAQSDDRFGGREERMAFLTRNGFDDAFWETRMRNQLLLDKYIEQRFQAFVRITRSQEDEYILENAKELNLTHVSDPVAAVPADHTLRDLIRKLLSDKALQERLTEHVRNLRDTAQIDYFNRTAETRELSENATRNHE